MSLNTLENQIAVLKAIIENKPVDFLQSGNWTRFKLDIGGIPFKVITK